MTVAGFSEHAAAAGTDMFTPEETALNEADASRRLWFTRATYLRVSPCESHAVD